MNGLQGLDDLAAMTKNESLLVGIERACARRHDGRQGEYGGGETLWPAGEQCAPLSRGSDATIELYIYVIKFSAGALSTRLGLARRIETAQAPLRH